MLCTGEDFTRDWLGKYKTELGAARRMKRLGFASASDIADRHLPGKPVPFARRGDIVLHPSQGCLGVCNSMMSHFVTEQGLTHVPTLDCLKAWGVD